MCPQVGQSSSQDTFGEFGGSRASLFIQSLSCTFWLATRGAMMQVRAQS